MSPNGSGVQTMSPVLSVLTIPDNPAPPTAAQSTAPRRDWESARFRLCCAPAAACSATPRARIRLARAAPLFTLTKRTRSHPTRRSRLALWTRPHSRPKSRRLEQCPRSVLRAPTFCNVFMGVAPSAPKLCARSLPVVRNSAQKLQPSSVAESGLLRITSRERVLLEGTAIRHRTSSSVDVAAEPQETIWRNSSCAQDDPILASDRPSPSLSQ